ncbi:exodeoxyribonuclease VII large subunit [Schaalia cardiffensis F0333]|uniref:Exodeoxyribonuclease 7 large subunit n=1 Tax=Schaalia cardiffensis F0333 TaxID=888050 RepID=N6X5M8_9ACTO|nr:exodeoxyribonuclease VII large subunit [Schaalia cardiffensis F0333]
MPNTPPRPPAAKAADTTRDNPWPLRRLTENIKIYVDRMSTLWVEGQVVEYKPRPGTKMAFFVLRDIESDTSMTVTAWPSLIDASGPAFVEGARVVTRVKPVFWERRGTLNLRAEEVVVEGLGDLLARIEMVRRRLAEEGLFAGERKKPLPFLPRTIGLICGRNAKAKDDVLVNAQARWPSARFQIREVAVQGERCLAEVTRALSELDAIEDVEVIVIARGGGSVEDLLPFSEEALVRAAARASTPIVSAIGHEGDAPLLDLVADYRASTPTDAARRIVPDIRQESEGVMQALTRMRAAIGTRLSREEHALQMLLSRPVLAGPGAVLDSHRVQLEHSTTHMRHAIERRLAAETQTLTQARASLAALSPQGTLDRGYAMLKLPDGTLVRDASQVPKGSLVEGIVARGRLLAQVIGSRPVSGQGSVASGNDGVVGGGPAAGASTGWGSTGLGSAGWGSSASEPVAGTSAGRPRASGASAGWEPIGGASVGSAFVDGASVDGAPTGGAFVFDSSPDEAPVLPRIFTAAQLQKMKEAEAAAKVCKRERSAAPSEHAKAGEADTVETAKEAEADEPLNSAEQERTVRRKVQARDSGASRAKVVQQAEQAEATEPPTSAEQTVLAAQAESVELSENHSTVAQGYEMKEQPENTKQPHTTEKTATTKQPDTAGKSETTKQPAATEVATTSSSSSPIAPSIQEN